MDGGAPSGIGTGRTCVSRFRRGTELPCDREHQCTPLLLRCGISTKNQETRRNRHCLVVRIRGPIPCGRGPDRRKAEEYLSRLLSFTIARACPITCAPIQRPNQMTKEDAGGRRVVRRQRRRALHLAGAALDDRADGSASSREHRVRKQRLLDGPAEFTAVRIDRSEKPSSNAG